MGNAPTKAPAVTVLAPGEEAEAFGVRIQAVPAYNIGKDFHPKEKAYLGFVATMDGLSVYHAGDTDFIPEMKGLRPQGRFREPMS